MKNIVISLMLIACMSAFVYVTTCDYVSADTCRNYVIEHQDSLEWYPKRDSFDNGNYFVLRCADMGMGYYDDMTILDMEDMRDRVQIIIWSDRNRFLYKYTPKQVDKVFQFDSDSLLLAILKGKYPIRSNP